MLFVLGLIPMGMGQGQDPALRPPLAQPRNSDALSKNESREAVRSYPELVDITPSTGIEFDHVSSPEQKFIVESMSGGSHLSQNDLRIHFGLGGMSEWKRLKFCGRRGRWKC
jgi:hypothetical protein